MKTCPYCASEVEVFNKMKFYCGFCDMAVVPNEDGNRVSRYKRKPFIDLKDSNLSTPELMLYHTFDLLHLLQLLRAERRSYFGHVTTFKKASNETDQFKEVEAEAGNEYEKITRKVWIVENLLIERLGYIPERISNELLETVLGRIEKSAKKAMIIKKATHISG